MNYTLLTAEEAASFVKDGFNVGISGFTPAGAIKAIPSEIAKIAKKEHDAGRNFKINLFTGASTGDSCDGELARADAINFRTPYQSNKDFRTAINSNKINFVDMHLSLAPQFVSYGFCGKIDLAIVEAADVTDDGEILLTTSVGATPTYLKYADKIIIELNEHHSKSLKGIHDIYMLENPPFRREIPIFDAMDKIGSPVVKVDPKKIIGVVKTDLQDEVGAFKAADPITTKIGENVAHFLATELKEGRIPAQFLPIQSGVGNIANAVLGALGANPEIPAFKMYSEVLQDSVIALVKEGRIAGASTTSLTVTSKTLDEIYENIDFYKQRLVIRPQEISNNPEVARRLGVISINTAIEVDLSGNVNSSHMFGSNLMNGIGGSGDFTRSAYISIFTCPSVAKGGNISSIVPLVSHVDHTEHSVQIIITEQGIADLRCKSPEQRAQIILENCVHPSFREDIRKYLDSVKHAHTPQTLSKAFAMHEKFLVDGDMHGAY